MKTSLGLMLAVPVLAQAALAQSSYTFVDLGLPPGRADVYGMNVADDARVLVYSSTNAGGTRSYLWKDGVYTDLGAFDGLGRCEAEDLDPNTGVVVGSSWSTSGYPARAWKWANGTFTNLGTLGGSYANAYSINASGQVTGWAEVPAPGLFFAYVHTDGAMRNLGEIPGDNESTGYEINDTGQVAASGMAAYGFNRACYADLNEGMHSIGTLGGPKSFVQAINNRGHIVGSSQIFSPTNNKDSYLLHAFLWRDGVMTDLGTLAGFQISGARDLNDSDLVVGQNWDSLSFTASRAFRWRNGVMEDLSTLVPGGTGAHNLAFGVSVNSAGVILVDTKVSGQRRVGLLMPSP